MGNPALGIILNLYLIFDHWGIQNYNFVIEGALILIRLMITGLKYILKDTFNKTKKTVNVLDITNFVKIF